MTGTDTRSVLLRFTTAMLLLGLGYLWLRSVLWSVEKGTGVLDATTTTFAVIPYAIGAIGSWVLVRRAGMPIAAVVAVLMTVGLGVILLSDTKQDVGVAVLAAACGGAALHLPYHVVDASRSDTVAWLGILGAFAMTVVATIIISGADPVPFGTVLAPLIAFLLGTWLALATPGGIRLYVGFPLAAAGSFFGVVLIPFTAVFLGPFCFSVPAFSLGYFVVAWMDLGRRDGPGMPTPVEVPPTVRE